MSFRKKIISLWGKPFRQKLVILSAFVLAVIVRFALWLLPFRVIDRILAKISSLFGRKPLSLDVEEAERIAVLAKSATQMVPYASCLVTALTAETLLGIRGLHCTLKIGVKKSETKKIDAHAWLQVGETIIVGDLPDLPEYIEMTPQSGEVEFRKA